MRDSHWLAGRLFLALLLFCTPTLLQAQEKDRPPEKREIAKELDEMRTGVGRSFEAMQKNIDALKEEVARLRNELAELRKEKAPITRESRSSPAATGSIRMVNAYVLPMTVVVNGTKYPLEPGETRLLRGQTPGGFTYEIPGVKGPVDRSLDPNETFTIRIFVR